MVGLSFCDFVGTREEKAIMAEYRKKEWPRRYKVTWNDTTLSGFCVEVNRNLCDMFLTIW